MALVEPSNSEEQNIRTAEFELTVVPEDASNWFAEWLAQPATISPEMKRLSDALDYPTE